jgi:crotonobetainyl-CoA:carnitine CoA-transferase CaiB-like acyl-CoA transferase
MSSLENLVVLDLSRVLAGPFCTQLLSDLGATVWKLESPWGGDDTRSWGPPFLDGESGYYLSLNRGKKSIAINIKDPRGQELVRGLANKADVLIENFKAGDLARYGLNYESLSKLNPRLIYASITGFGQTGPRASEPGYDAALQGATGIMSVTGEPEGPPIKVGVAWIDLLGGLTTAIGILAALHERERSNLGQHIDLSLFDVGLMSMLNQAQSYLLTGIPPHRLGTAHPQIVPYQAFEAEDGWFILAVGNDEQYRRMTECIAHPEFWDDVRFRTNTGRVQCREELVPKLAQIFRTRKRDVWLELLKGSGIPTSLVYDVAEAFQDPQAKDRKMVWEIVHPSLGKLPVVANALQHMSRTPALPQAHPPLLGEHTQEVLEQTLKLSGSELNGLIHDKVILIKR